MTARTQRAERAVTRHKVARYTNKPVHDAANLLAARIILSNQATYPPESLAARWAELVLARLAEQPEGRAA